MIKLRSLRFVQLKSGESSTRSCKHQMHGQTLFRAGRYLLEMISARAKRRLSLINNALREKGSGHARLMHGKQSYEQEKHTSQSLRIQICKTWRV